ncbi:ankyrin repeat domain-containing protein [bacterium]|nr:MAG: ankyrin repeat domain-containing protein [bacterium]
MKKHFLSLFLLMHINTISTLSAMCTRDVDMKEQETTYPVATTIIRNAQRHGITLLHIAAWNNAANWIRELIAQGANVYAIDDVGNTPYDAAANNGHFECAYILFEAMTIQQPVVVNEPAPSIPTRKRKRAE